MEIMTKRLDKMTINKKGQPLAKFKKLTNQLKQEELKENVPQLQNQGVQAELKL